MIIEPAGGQGTKRVVILGGGITALAAAYALDKSEERCAVTIVESGPQLGGNIRTIRKDGYVLDGGPDSWVAAKPHATRLARELGLGDELVGTRSSTRRVYIVWQRKLYPMPEGLIFGVPTAIKPLVESDLLGWDAKIRAGLDLFVPPRQWIGAEDESIGSFVSRRLGSDVAERIAGPLLGGIFAGDPASLSVRACAPTLVDAEREHGSLIVAMRALRARRREQAPVGETESSVFLSLRDGLGELVVKVAGALRNTQIFTSCAARRVDRLPAGDARGRWIVETDKSSLHADEVVLAVPGRSAATLVEGLDPALSAMFGGMAYASTAAVFLAYRRADVHHPLDAFGFLVPGSENRSTLACTFVSSKWDHRAPPGHVLLRVLVGGARDEHMIDRDDDELVRIARSELLDLLGIDSAPTFNEVVRFKRSSPQPHVGHLDRMNRLLTRAASHPGLHVGGNGYVGMGIPDAIRQGEGIAARILSGHAGPS